MFGRFSAKDNNQQDDIVCKICKNPVSISANKQHVTNKQQIKEQILSTVKDILTTEQFTKLKSQMIIHFDQRLDFSFEFRQDSSDKQVNQAVYILKSEYQQLLNSP